MSTAVMAGGAAIRGLASPNDTVRVAVVGCGGGRGSSHVNAWSGMPNVEVVALCDVDESHMANKLKMLEAKGLKKPATFVDFRKLLDDKGIDAVVIALPNHWHALATVWACQAGKDVYVEKPFSYDLWEGQQMVAAARKYGRMVQVGTQNRVQRVPPPGVRPPAQRRARGHPLRPRAEFTGPATASGRSTRPRRRRARGLRPLVRPGPQEAADAQAPVPL